MGENKIVLDATAGRTGTERSRSCVNIKSRLGDAKVTWVIQLPHRFRWGSEKSEHPLTSVRGKPPVPVARYLPIPNAWGWTNVVPYTRGEK